MKGQEHFITARNYEVIGSVWYEMKQRLMIEGAMKVEFSTFPQKIDWFLIRLNFNGGCNVDHESL